jgi:hypothetical protein
VWTYALQNPAEGAAQNMQNSTENAETLRVPMDICN